MLDHGDKLETRKRSVCGPREPYVRSASSIRDNEALISISETREPYVRPRSPM
jgi:hypothetical protein